MGLFDKFKKDDGPSSGPGGDDPFGPPPPGQSDDPFGTPSTSPADNDMFGAPPGGDPFGGPSSSPAPSSSPGGPGAPDPFSGEPSADRLDFNNPDLNAQTGMPRAQSASPPGAFHASSTPPMQHAPPSSASADTSSSAVEKDLQIIIAKLDVLKAELDSLHQRVRKIERIADDDHETAKKTSYQW